MNQSIWIQTFGDGKKCIFKAHALKAAKPYSACALNILRILV